MLKKKKKTKGKTTFKKINGKLFSAIVVALAFIDVYFSFIVVPKHMHKYILNLMLLPFIYCLLIDNVIILGRGCTIVRVIELSQSAKTTSHAENLA